jgi:hypothetical protein
MPRTVAIRRWNEEASAFLLVEEEWPTAAFDPASGRWHVEGPGWKLHLEGELSDEQAKRICEAAAGAIRFV